VRHVYKLIEAKLKPSVLDTPEAKLMFAIWAQALADVMVRIPKIRGPAPEQRAAYNQRVSQMHEAMEFLTNGPPVLDAAGIDAEYAWRIVHEVCEAHGAVITIPERA
jgi:hypothetical protein